jgi:hypothetical protein
MSVTAMFWEHKDFGGFSTTSDSGPFRYFWNKYGGAHNDAFSSMRAWAAGNRGNAYAFEDINFDGEFAALNVGGKYSSAWWSYFGDDFNDKVSSSLIVARAPQAAETEVPLKANVSAQFAPIFDAKTAGKPVSRDGDTRVYATYFPSYDPNKAFATIDQALKVQVRIPLKTRIKIWNPFGDDWIIEIDLGDFRWSDYAARVKYDVSFFVAQDGSLQGQADWVTVWVEGGVFSQKVFDDLKPPLVAAAADVTAAIQSALALFARSRFSDAYLLPGPPPDMDLAGFKARYDDDVTLVVVKA